MGQTLEERLRSRLATAVKQVEEMSSQSVTGYLVKRLIVEGSFRNTFGEDGAVKGFEVRVKNKLGVATVVGCTPLKIDGEVFGVETVTIEKSGRVYRATEISESFPMGVGFGDEILIRVEDEQGLESGKHQIELGLKMVGLGIMAVSYDDTLEGEGMKRVRKAAPAGGDFSGIMRRTIEMAAEHIGRESLAECSRTVRAIVLDLKDIGAQYSVEIGEDGSSQFKEGAASGAKVLTLRTTRKAFHDMAYNRLSPGIAYAKGEVALEGIPVLKLRGMDTLITSIFRGYRAASEGVEFAEAEAPAAGMLDEMLGMMFSAFDELLKGMDKLFARFGMKFFYEKSLNRIEALWDVLDREVRKLVAFGKETERPAEEKKAPATKAEAPAAKSLHERLRARITTVIETAVAEVSRTAVSGYLVKRLIMEKSFRNFEADGQVKGFELRLKNRLGVATVIGFADVKVDGEQFGLENIEITKGALKIPAAEVSDRRPLSVSFGDELLVRVARDGGIAPGKHRLGLSVEMVGLGMMDVEYEEELAG